MPRPISAAALKPLEDILANNPDVFEVEHIVRDGHKEKVIILRRKSETASKAKTIIL